MASDLIRDGRSMLAALKPKLENGVYHSCSMADTGRWSELLDRSLATYREKEGISLVLAAEHAEQHGFDLSTPMSLIVLEVYSALDGVGLTAGVATALANAAIPCNMIAAYHHDNVFVPTAMADRAVEILMALQRDAGDDGLPSTSGTS